MAEIFIYIFQHKKFEKFIKKFAFESKEYKKSGNLFKNSFDQKFENYNLCEINEKLIESISKLIN